MKLNDIIKKLLTTFSKEVAKDVSKLQKDIVNLKPKVVQIHQLVVIM